MLMLRQIQIMKLNKNCLNLCAAIIALWVSLQFSTGREIVGYQREHKAAPKYRIGYKWRTKENPSILVVQISINPDHFNREDMIALAQQLNKDFRREPKLNVAVCDEYQAAKSSGLINDLLMHRSPPALRAYYELDRVTGKEGISFSTARGKPLDEIDIDLSKLVKTNISF